MTVFPGTPNNDVLSGGASDDQFNGGAGNDSIYGNGGNDRALLGTGNDLAYGGEGNDTINAEAGNDLVHGDAGNDAIHGWDGVDTLDGGEGNDTLVGGENADVIMGGGGDDAIYGGDAATNFSFGITTIYAMDDDGDLFRLDPVTGGGGLEKVLIGRASTVMGDIGQAPDGTIYGIQLGGPTTNLYTINPNTGVSTLVRSIPAGGVPGSTGGGNALSFDSDGRAYFGTPNSSSMYRLTTDNVGTASVETWWTNPAGGTSAGDVIFFQGQAYVSWRAPDGTNQLFRMTVDGNNAVTSAQLIGTLPADSYGLSADALGNLYVSANGPNGPGLYAFSPPTAPIAGGTGAVPVSFVPGSSATPGDLWFGATSPTESTLSEASPDTNDLLFGGDGNDLIFGGNADDTIHGDNHNDTLHGDAGNDVLYGGDGADAAYGGDGNDLVLGEANNDSLYGDAGEDTLDGGAGNDLAYGGANNDVITGGAGSDHLYGDAGNDVLNGGGGGADTLTGGTGDDLFVISGGAGDSVFLSDFGAGETNGTNGSLDGSDGSWGDNDFVDLRFWYNDGNLDDYNTKYGTNFTNPLQALQHDAADGTLDFIAFQGGPTVTFTLVGSGAMDTEHTGVPCFTRGTMIETARGAVAIEDLRRGDLVETADHGLQPIRWVGSRRITAGDLEANPKLRPIRIRAGALGKGLPLQDVVVSPQHRVLVSSKIAERMFGEREVLVPARHLLLISGIDVAEDMPAVEYFHILFDRHQIVFAAGAPMESLFTGPEALKSVSPEARREIFEIFPELETLDATALPQPARPIQSGRIARKMAARHVQKGMAPINH